MALFCKPYQLGGHGNLIEQGSVWSREKISPRGHKKEDGAVKFRVEAVGNLGTARGPNPDGGLDWPSRVHSLRERECT